jgi:hypothetical protein
MEGATAESLPCPFPIVIPDVIRDPARPHRVKRESNTDRDQDQDGDHEREDANEQSRL